MPDHQKTMITAKKRSEKPRKMSMSAAERPNARRYAVRPVTTVTICVAALLLLAVPLFTLEADARGGGGGGGRGGGFGGGHCLCGGWGVLGGGRALGPGGGGGVFWGARP